MSFVMYNCGYQELFLDDQNIFTLKKQANKPN